MNETLKIDKNHLMSLRYNIFIIVSLKYEHTLFIKKIHMNQQSFTIQGVEQHVPLHLGTI